MARRESRNQPSFNDSTEFKMPVIKKIQMQKVQDAYGSSSIDSNRDAARLSHQSQRSQASNLPIASPLKRPLRHPKMPKLDIS